MASFFALTSPSLFLFSACVATIFFLWAIFWVPNHPWRRLWAYAQQAIAVILCSLLAIFVAFLAANRHSVWYSSWNDLFGFLSTRGTTQHFGGGAATNSPAKAATPTPSATPVSRFTDLQRNPQTNPALGTLARDAPNGQWVDVVVPGQGDRGDATARIWLPPSYVSDPDRSYPVIVAFAGVPGSPIGFEQPLHTHTDLLDAVNSGKIRDSVIVAPNVFPRDYDTECMDVPGAAIETWVTQQVVPWVKTNLRTETDPQAWAAYGYSAGGWCANMFTIRHPDLFGTSLSMSGYYSPAFPAGGEPANAQYYDLGEVVAQNRPAVRIWNYSGTGDGKFRRSFDGFAPRVAAPTSLTSVQIEGSSHRWPVWEQAQAQALEWLGQNAPAFAPNAGQPDLAARRG